MAENDDLDAGIRRVREQVSAVESTQSALERATQTPIPLPQARFTIATWVVPAFLVYVILLGAIIVFDGDATKDALLVDIAKTLLLPLVTLVLGYYFGSKAE